MKTSLATLVGLALLFSFPSGAEAQYPNNNPWLSAAAAQFYYDPSNTSGHASDNNNCTTSSTPCLTYKRILYRLGNMQDGSNDTSTVVNMLSTNVGVSPTDAISAYPCYRTGAFVIDGSLQQVGSSCTLSGVVAKNTTFASPQRLTVTASCITAQGQFLINTTHPSRAYAHINTTGSTWIVTQPIETCDAASNTCSRVEVNTWANGDTITAYTFPQAEITTLNSTCGSDLGYIGLEHLTIAKGTWITGNYPVVWEDEVIAGGDLELTGNYPEMVNVYHSGGFVEMNTTMTISGNWQWAGLVPGVGGGSFVSGAVLSRANVGLGVYIGNHVAVSGWLGENNFTTSDMYVDSSAFVNRPSVATGTIWGPGILFEQPGAPIAYTATTGSTVFHQGSGNIAAFGWGSNLRFCATDWTVAGPVAPTCAIVVFGSNVDTAIGSGGCAGSCWAPGGYGIVGQ